MLEGEQGSGSMRLDDLERSDNIEDRRGETGGGGGGFGLPIGGGGLGIGAVLVLGLIGWALGIDPRLLIGGAEVLSGGGTQIEQPYQPAGGGQARRTGAPSDDIGGFVSRILGSTEVQWKAIFQQAGQTYRPPILVLYQGQTEARCGGAAQSAMGPFYCPNDQKVYLDTSFFREIETRFHGCDVGSGSCQFSQAYVIAHEVGHHVQYLLGILPKVQQQQQGIDRAGANHLQVEVELQADCFAGVWANHENQRQLKEGHPAFIEPGDVEAALKTAAAIGDDRLQRQSGRVVSPDSFTHGTAEQRQRWLTTGLKEGTVAACNTFRATNL
jgi:predicted metalloprotease